MVVVENPAAQPVKAPSGEGRQEKTVLPDYFVRQRRWLVRAEGTRGTPSPLIRLLGPLSACMFVASVQYCHAMVDLLDPVNLAQDGFIRIVSVPGTALSLSFLGFVVRCTPGYSGTICQARPYPDHNTGAGARVCEGDRTRGRDACPHRFCRETIAHPSQSTEEDHTFSARTACISASLRGNGGVFCCQG
jgi:hypothetical protein